MHGTDDDGNLQAPDEMQQESFVQVRPAFELLCSKQQVVAKEGKV